jgi:hypothetical protein
MNFLCHLQGRSAVGGSTFLLNVCTILELRGTTPQETTICRFLICTLCVFYVM